VAADRRRLVRAFVRDGLRRGDRVVYVCRDDEPADVVVASAAQDDELRAAVARGTFTVLGAPAHAADGTLDIQRMLVTMREEHRRALADGHTGLSMAGDMSAAVPGVAENEWLGEYARALDRLDHTSLGLLCVYDHQRFAVATLSSLAAAHDIDVTPQLAGVGRAGTLAAGWVRADDALRLAGELDISSAADLADVLAAHFHGPLRLDLADLSFVDVFGMRALRGRIGQQLTIVAASDAVRRLLALLGWDTDPDIVLEPAFA
jgi:anti-anti-sigma factor